MSKIFKLIFGRELVELWLQGRGRTNRENGLNSNNNEKGAKSKTDIFETADFVQLIKQCFIALLLSYAAGIFACVMVAAVGIVLVPTGNLMVNGSITSLILTILLVIITPFSTICVFRRCILRAYGESKRNLYTDIFREKNNFCSVGIRGATLVLIYSLAIAVGAYAWGVPEAMDKFNTISDISTVLTTIAYTFMQIPVLIFISRKVSIIKVHSKDAINWLIIVGIVFLLQCADLQGYSFGYSYAFVASICYVACCRKWESSALIVLIQLTNNIILTVLGGVK